MELSLIFLSESTQVNKNLVLSMEKQIGTKYMNKSNWENDPNNIR